MSDKIGRPLEEIHTKGNVPQCTFTATALCPQISANYHHSVPDKSKLQNSLARFFTKLHTDKPVVRNNYFIQVVDPNPPPSTSNLGPLDPDQLSWSDSTNGPEDVFDEGSHAPSPEAQASGNIAFQVPPPLPVIDETFEGLEEGVRNIRFRTERQSLRRLPRSGAIVFTIRTYLDPIIELAREPGVPGRLASAIRSWPEDVAE